MSLLELFSKIAKPKLKCKMGGQCDLVRIKVSDGKSAQQYRWQCNKCLQQYFYSDSFLNGKNITSGETGVKS